MASAGLIRAVVDPGVLVSSLISGVGAPREIITRWRAGELGLVVSDVLLCELEDVLKRPKFRRYFSLEQAAEFLEELRASASIASEGCIFPVSPDPKDDYLLALAWASGVDYLVSGDGRHLLGLALSDYPPVPLQGNFWLSSKSATPVRAKAKR